MESSYLTLGLALIVAGFLFMAAELFIPTGGILSVLALAGIAVGVGMTFFHDTTTGLWTLAAVFVALPIVSILIYHYLPQTPIGRRMCLTGTPEDATVAGMPFNLELEHLKGRIGRTLSPLRPSGMVDFDGRRVDTVTEGMMVDAGQMVRCIDVRAGRVVVRPVEKPNLGDLETAVFN